jgi:hypothetical protein
LVIKVFNPCSFRIALKRVELIKTPLNRRKNDEAFHPWEHLGHGFMIHPRGYKNDHRVDQHSAVPIDSRSEVDFVLPSVFAGAALEELLRFPHTHLLISVQTFNGEIDRMHVPYLISTLSGQGREEAFAADRDQFFIDNR